MTEVLFECAPDVEAALVAWLAPLCRAAAFRKPSDELPFVLVHKVAGTESDPLAEDVVSVSTLCDVTFGYAAAANECELTHRRMLLLGRTLDNIELPDGRWVGIDYVMVAENPLWVVYSDQVLRKLGRYKIGLTYADADDLSS